MVEMRDAISELESAWIELPTLNRENTAWKKKKRNKKQTKTTTKREQSFQNLGDKKAKLGIFSVPEEEERDLGVKDIWRNNCWTLPKYGEMNKPTVLRNSVTLTPDKSKQNHARTSN